MTAFFDLDKTLSKKNLSFTFGKFLYRRSFFTFKDMLKLTGFYTRHKLGKISLFELHQKSYEQVFYGQRRAVLPQLMELYLLQEGSALFRPPLVEKLQELKGLGHEVILLSSSPSFVVEPVAKTLGFKECLSTRYGDAGVEFLLTGAEKGAYIKAHLSNKDSALKSLAFSDSIDDLPMLEAVEEPVAVFPDKRLRKVAFQRGWQIIS